MRVLHVVKTVDGAQWAIDQVAELVKSGLDVHVALPQMKGKFIERWRESGAQLHEVVVNLSPFGSIGVLKNIRRLVSEIAPDIIHSHFFNTTLALRYALGKNHPTPRVFQVPGPMHLEHAFFRNWELSAAGENDWWIASSRFTLGLYKQAGVPDDRLFLSYYGNRISPVAMNNANLRDKYGIGNDKLVVGNISYMYPPRLYLGQTRGIKGHEDLIDALAKVISTRDDVVGLIVGGQWGGGKRYEQKLFARAARVGSGRIIMTGVIPAAEAKSAWFNFDIAVHVPLSENCGGVVEPLMAGVPVIAAKTGGLPEVILDGITGKLVNPGNPDELADAINSVCDDYPRYKIMGGRGSKLVNHMFDVNRTASEIKAIYAHILEPSHPRPKFFDSREYLSQ